MEQRRHERRQKRSQKIYSAETYGRRTWRNLCNMLLTKVQGLKSAWNLPYFTWWRQIFSQRKLILQNSTWKECNNPQNWHKRRNLKDKTRGTNRNSTESGMDVGYYLVKNSHNRNLVLRICNHRPLRPECNQLGRSRKWRWRAFCPAFQGCLQETRMLTSICTFRQRESDERRDSRRPFLSSWNRTELFTAESKRRQSVYRIIFQNTQI